MSRLRAGLTPASPAAAERSGRHRRMPPTAVRGSLCAGVAGVARTWHCRSVLVVRTPRTRGTGPCHDQESRPPAAKDLRDGAWYYDPRLLRMPCDQLLRPGRGRRTSVHRVRLQPHRARAGRGVPGVWETARGAVDCACGKHARHAEAESAEDREVGRRGAFAAAGHGLDCYKLVELWMANHLRARWESGTRWLVRRVA